MTGVNCKGVKRHGVSLFDEWTIRLGLLFVIVFFVYARMLNADFVWDDTNLVLKNAYILDLTHLKQIFSSDLAAGAGQKYYFYRPIQNISYLIDYAIFGFNHWAYHAVNILLHLMVSWSVFRFISYLAKDGWTAFLTTAIFALHPVHSSVVCYVSSRADMLCALFMFCSLNCYFRSIKGNDPRELFFSLSFFVLALLSKEYAMILPVLMILIYAMDKSLLRIQSWGIFIAVVLVYMVMRIFLLPEILSPFHYVVPVISKIPGVFAALAEYMRLLIVPKSLHMSYGNFLFTFNDALVRKGVLGMFVLISMAVLGRRSFYGFGCGWLLLALVPVFIFPVNAFMAESWLYVPSVGYAFVLAVFIRKFLMLPNGRAAGCLLAVVILSFYGLVTWQQTRFWQNELVLFKWTALNAPYSAKVHYNLGSAYMRLGDRNQAVKSFKKALDLNPGIIEARQALEQLSN
jgi:tetratricopeptide (TPR) repeat protein